ncbi:MAG: hypothetical protein AB2A00_37905 [Myxococcota bacterium]
MRLKLLGVSLALALAPSCGPSTTGQNPDAGDTTPPDPTLVVDCPGQSGCAQGGAQQILAGAAKRVITPRGFEIARIEYLDSGHPDRCDPIMLATFGRAYCGELHDKFAEDCGVDGLCPNNRAEEDDPATADVNEATDGRDNDRDGVVDDPGYTAPDADGSERDGFPDYFHDCGQDRLCPDNVPESGAQATDGLDNDGDGATDGEDHAYTGPDEGEGDRIFQGLWIAGFGNNRPAMGIKDELWVRALALKTGETTVVMVSVDVVGFFYTEVERAREQLKQVAPEVDYLSVSGTHTHEAPDALGQWGFIDPIQEVPLTSGRPEGFNAQIVEMIVEAAAQAVSELTPASIHVGQDGTGVEGLLHDGRDPQIFDDTMTVVEARRLDNSATIFTMVNWGNHPESLSSANSHVSSDYSHTLRLGVESGLPAEGDKPARAGRGGVAVYMQGAVGGIMGPNGFDVTARDGTVYPRGNYTFARTDAYGYLLADKALEILDGAERMDTAELKVRARTILLPIENIYFRVAFYNGIFDRLAYTADGAVRDPEADYNDVPPFIKSEVFNLQLGELALYGVPGELFPELAVGGYDGSKSHGRELVPATHCPDKNTCSQRNDTCDRESCELCAAPDMSKAPAGPYFKDRLKGRFKMTMGLANDEVGYLVPSYAWEVSPTDPWFCEPVDHYEETNSTSMHAVPRVTEALETLWF